MIKFFPLKFTNSRSHVECPKIDDKHFQISCSSSLINWQSWKYATLVVWWSSTMSRYKKNTLRNFHNFMLSNENENDVIHATTLQCGFFWAKSRQDMSITNLKYLNARICFDIDQIFFKQKLLSSYTQQSYALNGHREQFLRVNNICVLKNESATLNRMRQEKKIKRKMLLQHFKRRGNRELSDEIYDSSMRSSLSGIPKTNMEWQKERRKKGKKNIFHYFIGRSSVGTERKKKFTSLEGEQSQHMSTFQIPHAFLCRPTVYHRWYRLSSYFGDQCVFCVL